MDAKVRAANQGRQAEHLDDCPYEFGDPLYDAWQDGWEKKWRYQAIMYWSGRYYAMHKKMPTVGEAAAVFFITAEEVAAVCDGPFLYLEHKDRSLPAQVIEQDGE